MCSAFNAVVRVGKSLKGRLSYRAYKQDGYSLVFLACWKTSKDATTSIFLRRRTLWKRGPSPRSTASCSTAVWSRSALCSVVASCPASHRVSLCNEKFTTFAPPGTREWLREVQLHPSLVRSRHVPLCGHPWFSLDPQSHRVYLPILGQQKGTSGVAAFALICIIVLFLTKTCSALPSPDFLLYPLGTSCASLLRHAYLGGYG